MRGTLHVLAATAAVATLAFIGPPRALAAPAKSIGTLTITELAPDPSSLFAFATAGNVVSSGGAGGAETGKFAFTKFTMTKAIDAMSPSILGATAGGKHVPEARIDLAALKGVRPVAVTIVLSEVLITSVALSDGGETIELTFSTIRETAHTPDGDVETCFDLKESKAC